MSFLFVKIVTIIIISEELGLFLHMFRLQIDVFESVVLDLVFKSSLIVGIVFSILDTWWSELDLYLWILFSTDYILTIN
jgi:hypothetical protein